MSLPLAKAVAARPAMTALEHGAWRDAIVARCGIDFGEGRAERLARCLWGRAREVGAASYVEYRRYIAFADREAVEWERLVDALVNRETRFFRHFASFEALAGIALPALAAGREKGGTSAGAAPGGAQKLACGSDTCAPSSLTPPTSGDTAAPSLTLWSAGCASGEEAWSLAMVAADALEGAAVPCRVLGLDLSEAALAHARRGRYPVSAVQSVPLLYRRRFLTAREDEGQGFYEIQPALADRVAFAKANLAADLPLELPPADIIFCQNVLIHFRTDRRLDVVRRLALRLSPGGFLFLAPGEMAGMKLPELDSLGLKEASVYRRV